MSEKVIQLKRQLVNPDTPKLSEILKYRSYFDVVIPEHQNATAYRSGPPFLEERFTGDDAVSVLSRRDRR